MKIGTWNVTTLKHDYRMGISSDKFIRLELDLLGVLETHILGVGTMKLCDIEFDYSGRKDWVHKLGVGFMVNKEAAKSCLGWEGINNRILIFHFITK